MHFNFCSLDLRGLDFIYDEPPFISFWRNVLKGSLISHPMQYKTVNPGKIGLDELYNLDSVFEIVRQMKYCRAVPEVVKSKENLAYLKDFISKVGYEN
jgi:hypothetical protein